MPIDLGPLPQGGGQNPIVATVRESVNAVGMMLGMYKPTSPEEAQKLRRRFMADAASLGVGAVAGAATGGLAAGVTPVARAILSSIVSGGASGATSAGIEGGDPLVGGLLGAAVGAPFGLLPGAGGKAARMLPWEEEEAATAARVAGGDKILRERPFVPEGNVAPDLESPMPGGPPAPETLDIDEIIRRETPMTPRHMPPPITRGPVGAEEAASASSLTAPEEAMSGTPILQRMAENLSDPGFMGMERGALRRGPPLYGGAPEWAQTFPRKPTPQYVPQWGPDIGPAPPGHAARAILGAGGNTSTSRKAIEEAIKEYRQWIREQLPPGGKPRYPSRMRYLRGLRPEVGPAEELASLEAGIKASLRDLPDEPTRLSQVLTDLGTMWRRGVRLSGNAIRKMGPAGVWLANNMDDVINRTERIASGDIYAIRGLAHKITKADAENIGGALAGEDVASNPNNARIVDQLRDVLRKIHTQAEEVGVPELDPRSRKLRPFEYVDNFFPLEYSPKLRASLLNPGSPESKAAVDRILSHHLGPETEEEAQQLLQRFVKTPSEFAYGPLQQMRLVVLPDYEKDFRQVLPRYVVNMWKRIEIARTFGPNSEAARKAMRIIGDQGYDESMVRDVYDVFSNRTPRDLNHLIRATRSFNTISLLSTAGVAQFAQNANTLAFTGMKHFLKGLAQLRTTEGREWAAKTGAYLQELMGEVAPDLGATHKTFGMELGGFLSPGALKQTITGPNRTAGWLQFIALTPLDKANRMIASLAGASWADENAARLVQAIGTGNAKEVEKLSRLFGRIGLKAEDIIKQQGVLTAEQRSIAGQGVSHLTQFRGSVLDMPAWARTTTMGQFAYLFKTFSIQQFRFINTLMQEARRGNFAPGLRYLSAAGVIGTPVGIAVRELRRRPTPDNPYWNVLEAQFNAGSVGIASDLVKAAERGPEYVLGLVTGPTASQIAALVHEGYQAGAGNPTPFLRDAVHHFPGIGPYAAELLFPKE